MKHEYLTAALFFVFTAAFFYLFYELMAPYFAPICWAAVFTLVFYPVYKWFVKNRWFKLPSWLASGVTCVVVVIVIIGPLTYLVIALIGEITTAVDTVNTMYKNGELDSLFSVQIPFVDTIREQLSKYYDISQINLDELAKDGINRISTIVLKQTSWVVANGTKALFYFVLMMFTMYYFFLDGVRLVGKVKRLIPIHNPQQVDTIVDKLYSVTHATMYWGTLIALLQGLVGGIVFALVGISSPVFWGALMAFLAIIPIVGASMVYLPAGLILLLGGHYWQGIVVLAVGFGVISQIDQFLRPIVMARGAQIHPLLLFFSIMGGIGLWGILGMVVGPLIAAVFITLLDILDFRMNPTEESPIITGKKAK